MHHYQNHHTDPASSNPPPPPAAGAADTLDFDWVLITSFMLLLLQLGLVLIIAGSVRYKNSQSVVIMILLNLTFGLIVWWLVSYFLNIYW